MKLDSNHALVNEPNNFNVSSPVFLQEAHGVIAIYSNENDVDLSEEDSKEEKKEKISEVLDHDPDGYILWIPSQYSENFLKFVPQFLVEQLNEGNLNFDNGGIAEAFFFHHVKDGMLVEMIDPECFTEVFENCINQFAEQEGTSLNNDDTVTEKEIFYVQSCHMASHIQSFEQYKNGPLMLKLLQEKNFEYSTYSA